MSTIAIIDDRREPRETNARILRATLKKRIEVVDVAPLPRVNDYPSWLSEHEVRALVLDERLNEQAPDSEGHVTYKGHMLVDSLRSHIPNFPIFILTAYEEDDALMRRFGKVEEIIAKRAFEEQHEAYAMRIERAAMRYDEYHSSLLAEFGERAQRIASGTAKADDVKRVEALRTLLGLAFPWEALKEREQALTELSEHLKRLERIIATAERKRKRS